ncbi:unnamed protein product, partial [Diabrotica balteata]
MKENMTHSMYIKKRYQISVLNNKDGKIIIDLTEKINRWSEYIRELFEDNRNNIVQVNGETGPEILKCEVEVALKNSKTGKANGPDEVPTELLKLLNDNSIGIILHLFNTIYKTGIIPQKWLLSTFVTLSKKSNAKECSEHRTISLMSHLLKIFLKVIHNRVYQKL